VVPEKKAERLMATYQVAGAGENINGAYVESGTFNGQPCYQNAASGWWLFWASGSSIWCLGSTKDEPYNGTVAYTCLTINGTWAASGSPPYPTIVALPAPTVTAGHSYSFSHPILTGQARAYDKWVLSADPMSIGGTVVRDDGLATDVSSVEYAFDAGTAFATQSVSPSATSFSLSASRSKAQVGALSAGAHHVTITLKDAGGAVLWTENVDFDTVAKCDDEVRGKTVTGTVTSPATHVSVALSAIYDFRHWDEVFITDLIRVSSEEMPSFLVAGSLFRSDEDAENDGDANAYVTEAGTGTTYAEVPAGHYDYVVQMLRKVAGSNPATYDVLASGSGSVAIDVSSTPPELPPNGPGTGDTTAPVVEITAPASGEYAGAFSVLGSVTDADGLVARVECWIDNVLMGAITGEPAATNFEGSYRFPGATGDYDTDSLRPGDHLIVLVGIDDSGNAAQDSVTLTQPSDTVAPVVAIESPATGATISGLTGIDVAAGDANGVARVALRIAGVDVTPNLFATNATAEDGSGLYRWSINTRNWANMAVLVEAFAWDNAGNVGTAVPVLVTVLNNLATETQVTYIRDHDPLLPETEGLLPGNGREGLLVLELPAPGGDARLNYAVDALMVRDSDTRDLSLYSPIPIEEIFALPEGEGTYKIAIRRTPMLFESEWESGADSIEQIAVLDDGSLLCWCRTAASNDSLLAFGTSSGFVDFVADLGHDDYTGVAVIGDKVYASRADVIEVLDLDPAPQQAYRLEGLVAGLVSVDKMTSDQETLYAAVTTGSGYRLLSVAGTQVTDLGALTAAVTALGVYGGVVFVGDADGDIYRYGSTGLVLESETGQDYVAAFGVVGTTVYAGTGTEGRVYRRTAGTGVWTQAARLPITEARAVAAFQGWLHAAGDARGIYREATDLSWSVSDQLEEGEEVVWMTGGDALLIATSTGRMVRIERAAGAGLVCGVGDVRAEFSIQSLLEA
jgi:hypothetical protein